MNTCHFCRSGFWPLTDDAEMHEIRLSCGESSSDFSSTMQEQKKEKP